MRACILSVCLNVGQLIANFQFDMHEMLTLHMLICALANSNGCNMIGILQSCMIHDKK